jgi:pyrroline-5-carboxylate reductase
MLGKTVGFIGGGRITRIMLAGFKRAGQMPPQVVVSDPNGEVLNRLKTEFPEIQPALNDSRPAAGSDLVFVALHPPLIGDILGELRATLKREAVVVSLAPKLTIARLAEGLGGFQRIVRMIPNAPSIINEGYNPVAFGPGLAPAEKEELLTWLRVLGECPGVAEDNLEAYAILTAMGPTYLWFQLYELQRLAESFGLSKTEAEAGLQKMVAGAVKTMYSSGLSPEAVMDLVPIKLLGEEQHHIQQLYQSKLEPLFKKLKG